MILICGPCVIESYESLYNDAKQIKTLVDKYPTIDFYFKSSCVKDNRSSIRNYFGTGFTTGIEYLLKVKDELGVKITTDFHNVDQLRDFGSSVDLIQIPAFLAMQTSLLIIASMLQKPIHIKKPQWLPPYDVSKPISKIIRDVPIFITDRGTTFGYGNVMFDPRHIRTMKNNNELCKVLVDITHLQNHSEIYDRSYAEQVGMAAIAAGADGLFMESTIDPTKALCDSDCMISIESFEKYIDKFVKLYRFINA